MCKPVFSKPLKDVEILDGEKLALSCSVNGDPEPQISWTKNGQKISSSEIMELKYKNGVASLTINEVFPEDDGVYVCIATNSIGSTETKSKVTIKSEFIIGSFHIIFIKIYNFRIKIKETCQIIVKYKSSS